MKPFILLEYMVSSHTSSKKFHKFHNPIRDRLFWAESPRQTGDTFTSRFLSALRWICPVCTIEVSKRRSWKSCAASCHIVQNLMLPYKTECVWTRDVAPWWHRAACQLMISVGAFATGQTISALPQHLCSTVCLRTIQWGSCTHNCFSPA